MMTVRSSDRLKRAVRTVLRDASTRHGAWAGLAMAMYCAGGSIPVQAAELPIPCAVGSCGINPFVRSGIASATVTGNTLNVNQSTNTAVLNWQQFNISRDGTVNFIQPSSAATAINRIHHATDPARILGSLNANGRVYLINRNGVIFGDGAKVDVAGLVASSLDITQDAIDHGIAGAAARNSAAFALFTDSSDAALPSGAVRVERGATITTKDGGQVLMFAPEVVNHGTISTPGGQTLLAAGSAVYLVTSNDDGLRGLLVEVDVGGTVTNGDAQHNATVQDPAQLVGQIIAERGNVTLAGLAVNQSGRVSATTTVRENGSIRLQARDGARIDLSDGVKLQTTNGGTLTLTERSVSEVTLSTDTTEKAVDASKQPSSRIELQGRQILALENSRVTATGGIIKATARANPGDSTAVINDAVISGTVNDGSRIYAAQGATFDVSGADTELAMERNVIRAELRGDELADSPMQRNGALRGQAVFLDVRQTGKRADGSTWVGTPVGNVSGQVSLVGRDVRERNLNGGSVSFESQGDVVLAQGSTVDVSGGHIRYLDGFINTTQLRGSDGRIYDIATADPTRVYTGTLSSQTVKHDRWGVTESFVTYGGRGRYEQGYLEGKDAGAVKVVTPRAILDGDIRAEVTVGRHQRQLAGAIPSGQLYRPFDQLPLGGQLTFGARTANTIDQVGSDVHIGGGIVLPTLLNDDGLPFDPLNDALPEGFTVTTLRSELFGPDRVARANVYSNGTVELPADVSVRLPGQGELSIEAGRVLLAGQVEAASGRISATARRTETTQLPDVQLDLRSSAVLDVSGRWVNDSPRLNAPGAQLAPLLIDGGTVTLSAEQGSLFTRAGSVIDVSGGGWARADSSIAAGDAGLIDLRASPNLIDPSASTVTLELGAELRAYGIERGGSLSIRAPEICITADALCGEDALALRPTQLLAAGFGSLAFTSNARGLTVKAGTSVDLQQRNRVLGATARDVATGTDIESFSRVEILPDHLRAATNLTLGTSVPPPPALPYTNATFADVPGLVVEEGARINAEAGATIALRSNSTLVVDGSISAPAGTISLLLDNTLSISEVLGAQGIWLGHSARLDVSGAVRLQPNELGLRRGDVLDGGRVDIVAQRGVVAASPGSVIDVSGTSATLDIDQTSGSRVTTTPAHIASDGGVIAVTASDGIVLSGTLNARAGEGSVTAQGGRLQVKLDSREQRGTSVLRLPLFEQRITISQDTPAVVLSPHSTLPDSLRGQAALSATDIEAAGFSTVALTARTSVVPNDVGVEIIAPGAVHLDGDVSLTLGRQLLIDAAQITGNGDARIAAPYISIGHSDVEYQQVPVAATGGSGELLVSGSLIELIGHSAINGFGSVRLQSEGDLRLRGIQQRGQQTVRGGLSTAADLTLRADQVYGTTLTNFALAVDNNPEGVLRIESTGGARSTVLSAASRLTLSAATIEQAGVLRAPFGTIELRADDIRLEAGSLTSTSAENAIVPFGSIQAGKDWVYGLNGQTLVVGNTTAIPEQRVLLDGERVDIGAGAIIDVSAGGDMQAYEFVPGPTGKRDVLSAAEEPNQFAIVPSLNLQYAPYDTQESAGTTLSVGDSIHLEAGVAGLPAGDYVLLPARYALLPGAYVVNVAEGYRDLGPGNVLRRLDGTTIVSGYRTIAGTSYADARTSGFAVRPASLIARDARYDTSRASSFFAAQAAANETAVPRLPRDAGVLSITAGAQLDIKGTLRAAAGTEGRGAAVDVSAQNLRISDSSTAVDNEVVVSAASLSALGAESILLGGRRASTSEGTSIAVAAQNVIVDEGSSLSAPEILIAASDTVRVNGGATLSAVGEGPVADTYLVDGDGAMLRLAAGAQAEIRRENEASVTGTLLLDQGSRLTAPGGALALDASVDTRSAASLSLSGGSLSFGAGRINLGDAPTDAAGLTIDDAQLNGLNLNELVLVSRSTIDLYGDIALSVNDLALDSAGLRGVQQNAGGSITAAESILLTNRANRATTDEPTSAGALALNADQITIGAGTQRISGFESVVLSASESLRGEEKGGLSVAGNLSIVTPVLIAATAAETELKADGALRVGAPASEPQANGRNADLGGEIKLTASTVDVASRIEAAAGVVSIRATTGDVTLASGAVIDVAGRMRDFDGVAVAAPAGEVLLASTNGNITTQAGSLIDIAAAGSGAAGEIKLEASSGTLSLSGAVAGSAQEITRSGRVSVDASNVGNLAALNATFNAGGLFAERKFRQRGAGDLLVEQTDLRARRVSLSADQGSVIVNGVIDARYVDGGRVALAARDSVAVNGSILASATSTNGDGGEVALRATTGGVLLGSSSVIDVSGGTGSEARGGTVGIRAPRSTVSTFVDDADPSNDAIDAIALAGVIRGARKTTLEIFQVYDDADGQIDATEVAAQAGNPLFDDASSLVAAVGAIKTALGRADDTSFSVLPGIEIQTAGDLALGPVRSATAPAAQVLNWDLSQWRFGADNNIPGVLTLRAGGHLTMNGSLSDGFVGVGGATTSAAFKLSATGDSWSYRLIAGADIGSADLMAVDPAAAGDFRIAPGNPSNSAGVASTFRMVRTGNGSIDVAAAGDFILGNRASVLYTAGVASVAGQTLGTGNNVGLGGRAYPINGGNISIAVGGDISATESTEPDSRHTNQLVTDWLWRVGKSAETTPDGFPTAWTVNFARFEQNVAALGGGDVDISAGGSIRNFSASIPSIGRPVAATTPATAATSQLEVIGGGDLTVRAGGDIAGGSFYVGRGRGLLHAGGDIAAERNPIPSTTPDMYPVLALGDGRWHAEARGSVGIEAVINPTLLPQATSQGSTASNLSVFSTYTPDSAVSLLAVSGDVALSNNTDALAEWLGSRMPLRTPDGVLEPALQIYAPNLQAAALSGDLTVDRRMTLFPAARSQVQLFAEHDITRKDPAVSLSFLQSDADPAYLPSLTAPQNDQTRVREVLGPNSGFSPNFHAATPVHAGDGAMSRLVARTGDISFAAPEGALVENESLLQFAAPVRIIAGGDIVDLPVTVQHNDSTDVSTVLAGRDLRYTISRSEGGAILPNSLGIDVDGPGTLQLIAGRNVDLQTSRGVTTRGNIINKNLPKEGASISVLAGLNGRQPQYDPMIGRYLELGTGHEADLIAYIKERTGEEDLELAEAQERFKQLADYRRDLVAFVQARSDRSNLTEAEALAVFRGYSRAEQRLLLDRVMVSELRYSGREAAKTGSKDFTRAFTALETLFPGSNPDTDAGSKNAYAGDIALYFSRMYALAGGDISLFAPGGGINVGLAAPPSSYGLTKTAADLGIVIRGAGDVSAVTYGDFQVNESRVFAADGGDILVWSTNGDIDAGRGAKTAISAPAPTITFDPNGTPIVNFSPALTGSGIQTLASSAGVKPGDVDLFAPRGVVNAGDAGIVAGNLTIAATAVLGADNIQVSGVAVGVPVDTGGLGASLAGVAAAASSASSAATTSVEGSGPEEKQQTLADAALSWLEVFVIGLGEDVCKQDDVACLKRQQTLN